MVPTALDQSRFSPGRPQALAPPMEHWAFPAKLIRPPLQLPIQLPLSAAVPALCSSKMGDAELELKVPFCHWLSE